MSQIDEVKKLRKICGAGFNDCFAALKEAGGDIEKALEILNKISNGEKPIPGSYRGRVNNEPENNRTTLMDLKNA